MTVKNNRIFSVVLSVGPTSMPVNDLVPLLARSEFINYRRVVIKVEKKIICNEFEKFTTHSGSRIIVNKIGIISFLLLLLRLRLAIKLSWNTTFHFHNALLCFFSIFLIGSKRLFSVVNLHNDWQNFSYLQKFGLIVGFRTCVKLVCVSSYITNTIPNEVIKFTNLRDKMFSISNFVNTEELFSDRNENQARVFDVVIVGRLVPQKNWTAMISVLAKCECVRSIKWFGSGFQIEEAKRQVYKFGLSDNVEFLGIRPRHEVIAYLKSAKVYMCLSLWEGIGVANLEAIGCGCHPVLSSIGPHIEIARELNFKTFSLRNETGIASYIDNIVSNPSPFRISKNVFDAKFGKNSTKGLYENVLRTI